MADIASIETILERERGLPTAVACKRLGLSVRDLLALRRRLLESALGVRPLPPLTAAEVEQALLHERRGP